MTDQTQLEFHPDEYITAPVPPSRPSPWQRVPWLRTALGIGVLAILGAVVIVTLSGRDPRMLDRDAHLASLLLSSADPSDAVARGRAVAGQWVGTIDGAKGSRQAVALVLTAGPDEDGKMGLRFVFSGTTFVQRGDADFDPQSGVLRLSNEARLAAGTGAARPTVLRAVAPWRGALRRIEE